jgi:hypothetical protein
VRLVHLACLSAFVAILSLPAASQPDNKGHGKGGGGGPPPHAQGAGGNSGGNSSSGGNSYSGNRGGSDGRYTVSDRDRDAVYGYYRTEYAAGNCPPGLAKKNNGCLPPGQAKKMWAVGQPLARNVYYEPLPPALIGRLSPAPAGYQYVRVASDILMLAVGTRMVTAAIADLSRF